ncbi:carboxylesterase/lipase family protein [Yinghuangia seranimata]|uniref:carboxylesterase/lipase family protein n=1 Tax=Yinghuangia seranimata TaxID=408067 RepID=UPI00248B601F|nr:carboxylesterase family protein [Yinghuangia seranimata]MDI2130682.1 carboxylesterase family protein [Yinghuangia seranimata]
MAPTVATTSGRVEGVFESVDGGVVAVFRGVPYAAPPEGALRFAAPAPPTPWDGVRPAHAFGTAPPQSAMVPGTPAPWEPEDGLDCLTANVWTPEPGAAGLPVMVWIYGGAWRYGHSGEAMYDAGRLARAGVVVVSFNYRVGFEGLGHVPGAPENRALLDQVAALRWVRENVAAFGGDPDRVTIFGESAGGTSVATLTAAEPYTRGLFRRAIAQSVAGRPVPLADAHRVTAMVATAAGVPATAEGLRSLSPARLLAAQDAPLAAIEADPDGWSFGDTVTCYAPVADGDVITGTPWELLRAGARPDVDLLCGYTTDEYTLFAVQLETMGDAAGVAARMGLDAAAVDAYRAANPGLDDRALAVVMRSDQVFRMPSTWVAEAHAAAGGRAFLYEFAWRSPALGGALGACHAIDVPFVFGNAQGPFAELVLGAPVPPEFEELSRQVREAWVAFARTGDPGWPAFTTADAKTRIWDVPLRMESDPQRASRAIWRAASGLAEER